MSPAKMSAVEEEQFVRQEIEHFLASITTLTGLSEQDFATLRSLAPVCQPWADDIASQIREHLLALPDGERYLNTYLNGDLAGWYRSLFEVTDVDAFWAKQMDLAVFHVRHDVPNEIVVGLAPRWIEISNLYAHRYLEGDQVLACMRVLTRVLGGTIAVMVRMREMVMLHTFMETTGFSQTLIQRLWENAITTFTDRLRSIEAEYFRERGKA